MKTLRTGIAMLALAMVSTFTYVHAQSAPLPLGKVLDVRKLASCSGGFYKGMTCFQAEMSCPSTAEIQFTYGSEEPSGIPVGTVVFLEGGNGTSAAGGEDYLARYLESGFQVVQMAWKSAWEATGQGNAASIKTAACRPATFLNFISQNVAAAEGAMCAQGDSAGSGAVAYSLAWYGAGDFLDKVELMSGPVFGDLEQGCIVPNAPVSTVCPSGQFGCDGLPWPDSPAYVGGDITAIDHWSGDSTCNGKNTTSQASNLHWKAMSIVDGTTNPSFSYPKTAMAGWLCSNIAPAQNNSAAQGQFFYEQFTNSGQTAGYSVTRIDHCSGNEGVSDGVTPQGESGLNAISHDMIAGCIKRHEKTK
jgi:hypothetical protein